MATAVNVIDQRLVLLRRHWHQQRWPEYREEPLQKSRCRISIAISREAGAQGAKVAQEIGKRLNWPVYDREILDLIADRSVLRSELLASIDEHDRNWFVETLTSLGHPGEISSAGYFHHLRQVLASLASHGKCVIVGRGATALLQPATTLRLRIIAPFEQRVHAISEANHLGYREAQKRTREIDYERAQFMSNHFHKDLNDPHGFDLILNTDRFSIRRCAELAVRAVEACKNNREHPGRESQAHTSREQRQQQGQQGKF